MKFKLPIILIVFCCLTAFGQKPAEKSGKIKIEAQQILIKKQILADQLENQIRDVPLAAVRVFVRMKLAEWLWKDGKDETGRAEQIAVRAVEELYENKTEIPNTVFYEPALFSLLEFNAKDAAKKLKAKYNIGSYDDLSNAYPLLEKEGGDKIVSEKIKKYLAEEVDLSRVYFFLMRLKEQKSPEFLAVLSEIVNLEETGKNNFSAMTFPFIIDNFRDASVPNALRIRFYRVILGKAREALQSGNTDKISFADGLLYAVLSDINSNAPGLSAEANVLRVALSAQNSQSLKDAEERYKRIRESADKLAATIAEAEKEDSKSEKANLYHNAALLATKEEKFQFAVDLYEKYRELTADDASLTAFRYSYYDQQLREIVRLALDKDDIDSARYATKKIIEGLSKSEALRQTAIYFYEKKDLVSALDAYDEALKLAEKADDGSLKLYTLSRLISAAQKIDKSRISEITNITAKAIDRMPTLDAEDRPGTKKFTEYVSRTMAANTNVYSVMNALVKDNRNEAMDFASRINRKEIRITADLALAIDEIEKEKSKIK